MFKIISIQRNAKSVCLKVVDSNNVIHIMFLPFSVFDRLLSGARLNGYEDIAAIGATIYASAIPAIAGQTVKCKRWNRETNVTSISDVTVTTAQLVIQDFDSLVLTVDDNKLTSILHGRAVGNAQMKLVEFATNMRSTNLQIGGGNKPADAPAPVEVPEVEAAK